METVEATGIGDEPWSLSFEDFPDGSVRELRMSVRFGVSNAFIDSQAFSSSSVLKRSRGVKNRSRTSPTWFSTWPFSQPDAGVQATGSTR
jgi:hypothetical protein